MSSLFEIFYFFLGLSTISGLARDTRTIAKRGILGDIASSIDDIFGGNEDANSNSGTTITKITPINTLTPVANPGHVVVPITGVSSLNTVQTLIPVTSINQAATPGGIAVPVSGVSNFNTVQTLTPLTSINQVATPGQINVPVMGVSNLNTVQTINPAITTGQTVQGIQAVFPASGQGSLPGDTLININSGVGNEMNQGGAYIDSGAAVGSKNVLVNSNTGVKGAGYHGGYVSNGVGFANTNTAGAIINSQTNSNIDVKETVHQDGFSSGTNTINQVHSNTVTGNIGYQQGFVNGGGSTVSINSEGSTNSLGIKDTAYHGSHFNGDSKGTNTIIQIKYNPDSEGIGYHGGFVNGATTNINSLGITNMGAKGNDYTVSYEGTGYHGEGNGGNAITGISSQSKTKSSSINEAVYQGGGYIHGAASGPNTIIQIKSNSGSGGIGYHEGFINGVNANANANGETESLSIINNSGSKGNAYSTSTSETKGTLYSGSYHPGVVVINRGHASSLGNSEIRLPSGGTNSKVIVVNNGESSSHSNIGGYRVTIPGGSTIITSSGTRIQNLLNDDVDKTNTHVHVH